MNRWHWFAFIVLLSAPGAEAMEEGKGEKRLGVGVAFGAPTGLSMKYWLGGELAVQAYIGSGFEGGLAVGADYLVHSNETGYSRLPFYFGPGVFLGDAIYSGPTYSAGNLYLGIRGVFGVDYLLPNRPFDLAIELGPSLLLAPTIGLGIELGLAFRFYP